MKSLSWIALSLGVWFALTLPALAVEIPGAADVGRINPDQRVPIIEQRKDDGEALSSGAVAVNVPPGAEDIHFTLKAVHVEGATAFSEQQLNDLYAPYIGKNITLDKMYIVAGKITERYRAAGYFLSIAYIPPQQIDGGIIIIQVVEGKIGRVKIKGDLENSAIIQAYVARLQEQSPLTSKELESFLLRLNDLPGYNFSSVLSAMEGAEDGVMELTLLSTPKTGKGSVTFDNYGSRFLGPNQTSASYAASLLPMQQTNASGLIGLPTEKLHYFALNHAIIIAPDVKLSVNGGYTKANPGFTLEVFDVESDSTFFGTAVEYQWIRQRQENLSLSFSFDSRDSNTDILDTPFTRDKVRVVRSNVTYDMADDWRGYNIVSATLSRGIAGLGANDKGDSNLSRADAVPDFTKLQLSISRLQVLNDRWTVLLSASAQRASSPLFSSEEFGYGGQVFGRAFDDSEISGDHGASGSIELRYSGWQPLDDVNILPYAFYDIGAVWNEDVAQTKHEAAASAGAGVRVLSSIGLSSNVSLAWPLTRRVATPIYGQDDNGPRINVQVGQTF